jgi:hypothetical protein
MLCLGAKDACETEKGDSQKTNEILVVITSRII